MNTHLGKSPENKNNAVANALVKGQVRNEPAFQFVDNRTAATGQMEIQEMANNSPQVKQLRAVQEMAKNYVAQRKENPEAIVQKKSTPLQKKMNSTGLPDQLKTGVENLSGYSLDDVKVHYNSTKPMQLKAHAYAQGTEIHVAPGQERHLPHEAWHVVQQKQGRVQPTLQLKAGIYVNNNEGLESEATKMGNLAMHSQEGFRRNEGPDPGKPIRHKVAQLVEIKYFPSKTPTVLFQQGKEVNKIQESDGAIVKNIKTGEYEKLGGGPTSDKVRIVSGFMTGMFGIPFIAGHMLNKHLGGRGDLNENITSISASANSQQSKQVEEPAKAAVRKPNSDVTYWTKVSHRGKVAKDAQNYVDGHAIQIEAGYVDNTTKTGITRQINTVDPLKRLHPVEATGFAGDAKVGGAEDKKAAAKVTTLSYVEKEIKAKLDPANVFGDLLKVVESLGRRIADGLYHHFPSMPEAVVETCENWSTSAREIKDRDPKVLFSMLNSISDTVWLDIYLAMKYKIPLWELLDNYIKVHGEVPDDPQKAALYILAFQKTVM